MIHVMLCQIQYLYKIKNEVEKVSAGKTITKNKIVKTTNTVKTGDTARVFLFCVLALISGLILLAYGIYTLNKNTKRRRQKGE